MSQLTGDGGAGAVCVRAHRTLVLTNFLSRAERFSRPPVEFTTQPLPRGAGHCRLPGAAQDPLVGEEVPGPSSGERSGCSAPPQPFRMTLPSALSGAGVGSWGGRWGAWPPIPTNVGAREAGWGKGALQCKGRASAVQDGPRVQWQVGSLGRAVGVACIPVGCGGLWEQEEGEPSSRSPRFPASEGGRRPARSLSHLVTPPQRASLSQGLPPGCPGAACRRGTGVGDWRPASPREGCFPRRPPPGRPRGNTPWGPAPFQPPGASSPVDGASPASAGLLAECAGRSRRAAQVVPACGRSCGGVSAGTSAVRATRCGRRRDGVLLAARCDGTRVLPLVRLQGRPVGGGSQ